jgi:hypothetical protein
VATTEEIDAKKTLILMEIGEFDDSGPVASNIDALWNAESGKGGTDLELQYLFVKRKALDITIGSIWRGNFVPVGTVQHKALDDRSNFLRQLRSDTQKEIDSYVGLATINLDIYEPTPTGY